MRALVFIPAVITGIFSLNLAPSHLLVTRFKPFEIYGLSLVQFESGPIFYMHYFFSNFFITLACILLFKKAFQEEVNSKNYFILSLGMVFGYLIDLYAVALNPDFRFTMISAGTFLISDSAIFYISKATGFFGLIKHDEEINQKFQFQNKLLTLIGHDLTGNIHQLARLSSLLKNTKNDSNELIKVISDTSLSSAELISNLMKWVRSQENNDFTLSSEQIDIKTLITQLLNSLSPVYPNIQRIAKLELGPDPLFLNADREMLTSILRNLFTNAYKACDPIGDDRYIRIKITQTSDRVFFEISDNGIGLDYIEIKNLFQINKTKSSEKGYGIGLCLVKMMIEIHRGVIEIKSQKNQGTQVYFSLPS